jgi:competence protein ComEC
LIVKLTLFFRFPRRLALLVNSIFLIIYPIFTGLSASAVRAGLMGLLVLLAFYEGRLITSIRAVVFSAALMLIFNPQLLRADLGFQLSYLAVLGIIYLYPLFSAIKKIYPKYLNGFLLTFFKNLTDVLSITLACQITTMPIMLINFKQVSLISPLANILVIWTFPFLFIALIAPLILISLIPGAIFPLLGPWLFAPAYFLLFYIFSLARYLAAFPWAVKIVEDFNWFEAFIYYLLLSLIIFLFQRKIKQGSQTKAPP